MRIRQMIGSSWALLAMVLLSGCVISLQPLYSEETVVFDPALLGSWSGDGGDATWTFEADDPLSYELTVLQDGNRGVFATHLVELDGVRFLDLYPEEPDDVFVDLYTVALVPAHLIFRVDRIDDELVLRVIDNEWLEAVLNETP